MLHYFTTTTKKKVSNIESVSEKEYQNEIPNDMSLKRLNSIYYELFGMDATEIMLFRLLTSNKNQILITEFSLNGFFWGQIECNDTVCFYII